ncbi:hypothetical protein [Nonomuraea fuscirosea]|nr:hypothetical protein [Nonomuraea fuscirosea]
MLIRLSCSSKKTSKGPRIPKASAKTSITPAATRVSDTGVTAQAIKRRR